MANVNTPFGLSPFRTSGNTFNGRATLYSIPSADGSAYYLGDAVKQATSGDANGVPNVQKATGTDTLRGVIVAIFPVFPGNSIQGVPLALENPSIPATKTNAWYVAVADDTAEVYMVQDDGITTANLVAASCNKNFSLTITAGATAQSQSASVILSSSFATTNTLNMKCMGLAPIPGNVFGSYAKWVCRINVHELAGSTVGI